MRGVAARLETGPSSLYAWVRDQRELHLLVLDAIASEVSPPDEASGAEQQLVDLLLDYARRLFACPGAARLALAAQPTGRAHLDLLERTLGILERRGLDPPTAAATGDTLFLLVTGTLAEQEARTAHATPGSIPELFGAALSDDMAGRWPRLSQAHAALATLDGEERLAWSIRTFLRGAAP